MQNELSNAKDRELLQLYRDVMEELRSRKLIRSSNNPVADYAEKVAVERLNLSRAGKENRGYDALDKQKRRYQIKGRRITKHNSSRQLGVIRNIEDKLFDYLVAIIFNEDFSVKEIWKVPYQYVKENSRFSKHQNGHIFFARPNQLSEVQGIERIQ